VSLFGIQEVGDRPIRTIRGIIVSDEEESISVVDAAYEIIVDSDREWTIDGLITALDRAGFPLEDEAELDPIMDAVQERIENENVVTEAIKMFLGQNGSQDLEQAAEEMDCTAEEIVEMIVANANIFGKPH